MGAASDLHDLAADVLEAAVEILNSENAGAPDRAYVSHGPPALDCEQITVHVTNVGEAVTQTVDPLTPGVRKNRVNLTGLMVTVVRCYPTVDERGRPPKVDALNQAAALLNADAWALWNGLWRMRGDLFADCDLVFFDGVAPIVPQGGFAGWILQTRFELGGYQPALGS